MDRSTWCRLEHNLKVEHAKFVLTAVRKADLIGDGRLQFAFVGRSNVGKSSLLNRLVRRKSLAKISSSPGKTRAVNYFLIDDRFYLVDLPGYGYAKAGKSERQAWAKLMDDYFQSTVPRPSSQGETPTVVATKLDRIPRGKRKKQLDQIREALALPDSTLLTPFSARTGEGIKELWKEIHGQLRVVAERAN
jgi:GTP-binding protein